MDTDIIAVILCLIGSGFFSASETALTSLPVTRLEALRTRSGKLTRAGLGSLGIGTPGLLDHHPGRQQPGQRARLSSRDKDRLPLLRRWRSGGGRGSHDPRDPDLRRDHTQDPCPAPRRGDFVAGSSPILYVLDLILTPVNRILGLLARLLSRGEGPELPVTEEDLLFMLRLAHRHAHLPRDSRLMIESVLRFQRAVAREVMVPRPMVSTVDASWDLGCLAGSNCRDSPQPFSSCLRLSRQHCRRSPRQAPLASRLREAVDRARRAARVHSRDTIRSPISFRISNVRASTSRWSSMSLAVSPVW